MKEEEEERTPLRTILQNFLNHIEKLDKENLEGSYDKEFQELKLFSEFLKTSKQYSCSQGEKEVNRKKNRYKDILPFDCSRVILEDYAGIPGSDYINANYIKGASGSPAYIASQGPLPHTVNDFWRMVVQCEVQVIVMACNEEESGKHKCENYWVEREGEEKQFGMVAIQLIKASVVCPDFLVRTMRLKYTKNHSTTQEERTVCQFHYSAWPDHGVPPLVRPLLDMVRLVRDTQASETLPVLVHCSAGCGRTGTICAIDYVWGLLRAGKLTKDFSLFKLVREMRKQRIAMVQTKEQYVLVHRAVKELFNEQLRMIDSHPYENIDVNGMVKESPEPVYATIKFDPSNEEKQDSNEKEHTVLGNEEVPPLPCKRRPYTVHTKQEKEVENLTQKQRSSIGGQISASECPSPTTGISSSSGTGSGSSSGTGSGSSSSNSSTCGSLLHKPRIAKLRALFERTSNREGKSITGKQRAPQQVTRSHSLGAVRKLEEGAMCVQPIPNGGVLRVPQLSDSSNASSVGAGRPTLPIKRSKSLKVLSSGERMKFSVPIQQSASAQECASRQQPVLERAVSNLTPKVTSSYNQKRVVSESKPLVPPKKAVKEKISDKISMNMRNESESSGSQKSVNVHKRSSEDGMLPSSSLSGNLWRRSLDSLTLESEGAVFQTFPTYTHTPVTRKAPFKLDEEARKLLQDCRDYLSASEKSKTYARLSNPQQKFQNSQKELDSLQHLTVEAQRKVNAVVGGLGTRERRNSFRQAISKELETGAKSQNLQRRQFNMPTSCSFDGSKNLVPMTGSGKSASDKLLVRMSGFPKHSVQTPPSQISAHLHAVPSRMYRPKTRSPQKTDSALGAQFPTGDPSSKVSDAMPMDSAVNGGFVNHSTAEESRRVTRAEYSTGNVNAGGSQSNKISSVKGNKLISVACQGVKPAHSNIHPNKHNSNTSPNVSLNPAPVPGQQRSAEAHIELCADARLSATSALVCDFKDVNGAQRSSAASNPRFVPLSAINAKQYECTNVSESESYMPGRVSFTEVSRLPQNLAVKQDSLKHSSALNENISIMQEATHGIRQPRPTECHNPSTRVLNKGEVDSSTSLKHQVPGSGDRSKVWCEGLPVNVHEMRQSERRGHAEGRAAQPRLPGKQSSPAGLIVHPQERRFPLRMTQKPTAVASHELNPGEIHAAPGRGAAKLSIKQRSSPKEGAISPPLHHGSQDDLALCVSGGASSSRVRRHASVVMLRHSLIENDSAPVPPLTVWNQPESVKNVGDSSSRHNISRHDLEAWNVAPGVDVDMVGASIKPSRDHGTALTRALEAFHLRKPSRGAAVATATTAAAAIVSPPQQRKFPQAQQVFVKKQHYL